MGCDIHLYVEKYNPIDGQWNKVDKVFFNNFVIGSIKKDLEETFGMDDNESDEIIKKFKLGTPPSNRTEQYVLNKYIPSKMVGKGVPWWEAEEQGKYPHPYTDQPYAGRCYRLFGILAQVRDTSLDPIHPDVYRGLPTDVSPEVEEMSDEWEGDAHSHNYLTVGEILGSQYGKMTAQELNRLGIDPYFFHRVIPDILELGDKDSMRIVFWFDN
jgi:hypothetical protein